MLLNPSPRCVFLGVLYVKVLLWKILARLSAYVPLTRYSFMIEPQYRSKITNFRSSLERLRSPHHLSFSRWRGHCLWRKRSEDETERESLCISEFGSKGLPSCCLFVSMAWCWGVWFTLQGLGPNLSNDIFVPVRKGCTVNTCGEVTIRVYSPLMIDIDSR